MLACDVNPALAVPIDLTTICLFRVHTDVLESKMVCEVQSDCPLHKLVTVKCFSPFIAISSKTCISHV
ncbi:hypothetical protein HBI54_022250 [Parastagonospora nodorum]|nr:hypothetical protein HBI54_022250 [Parastagonospora nodorum]